MTKKISMRQIATIFSITLVVGCASSQTDSKYLRWVGDSEYDEKLDDVDFKICGTENWVKQYFNFFQGLSYKGEKIELERQIRAGYKSVKSEQSGWIRIRFVVNCKGKTGRFRIIESDEDYKAQEFDDKITNQLLKITKSLDGWGILPNPEKPEDYYQYLVFKIEKGHLKEIMP